MYENRKRYSQNFLRSRETVERMLEVSGIDFANVNHLIEIGPGKGIITKELIKRIPKNSKFTAVEIDPILFRQLRKDTSLSKHVEFINRDFRDFPLPQDPFTVVSNIPFCCTSEIISKILDAEDHMKEALVIIQKEAAHMYMGANGSNLKSLMAYPFWDLEILMELNRCHFDPVTTVDPVLLKITRKVEPLISFSKYQSYYSFIKKIVKDRVGEGIWKIMSTKDELRSLYKEKKLIKGRGVSAQEPEVILQAYKAYRS